MATTLFTNPAVKEQSQHERITYTVTTTVIGSNPINVAVSAYDITGRQRTDVTATVMPVGAPVVVGDVITWPELLNLTPNRLYRVETLFETGGNRFKAVTIFSAVD